MKGFAGGFVVALGCLGGCSSGPGNGGTVTIISGTAGVTGQDCAARGYPTQQIPPDVLIVLDTSTSMNDPIGGPCDGGCSTDTKWAAAVAGINTVVNGKNPIANWGLAFVASATDACDADGIAEPIGTAGVLIAQALASRTSGSSLLGGGNRPTRAALKLATAYLSGRTAGARPIILLITDGGPACRPGAPDVFTEDAEGAVAAVTGAAQLGIPTVVAGLATAGGPADPALNAMAAAGGRARAGAPAYVPIAGSADLAAAMAELVAREAACTFTIPPPPTQDGTSSREDIGVVAEGAPQIPADANNGWTYTDTTHTAIELHGTACDAARAGTIKNVSIVFHCFKGP